MPVFISYERSDEATATAVYAGLTTRKITAYLDLLDPALVNSENATAPILAGVEKCTHLLTIVSATTKISWWVPFEIGAATRGAKRITTYHRDDSTLPDYLKIWPVLRSLAQLETYARRYFEDSSHGETNYAFAESYRKTLSRPQDFHAALRRDLGQR